GRGPTGNVLAAGQGNNTLRFDVVADPVTDGSADPATIAKFYDLPTTTDAPRITRTFQIVRTNGQWAINNQFMNCNTTRFRVKRNKGEKCILEQSPDGSDPPVHIHLEEFQILKINGGGVPAGSVDKSRRDVMRLEHNQQVELYFRFRDFVGRYPLHCHNTVHE